MGHTDLTEKAKQWDLSSREWPRWEGACGLKGQPSPSVWLRNEPPKQQDGPGPRGLVSGVPGLHQVRALFLGRFSRTAW